MSPEGWRHWAPFLEKSRPKADSWPQGDLPDAPFVCLFADGFLSASHTHWINRPELQPGLRRAKLLTAVCGYSYVGRGLPYETEHTRLNVYKTSNRFHSYIEVAARTKKRIIPIGFSLGAVVILLGIEKWLRLHPDENREIIPAVILVAPAIATAHELLDSYEALAAEKGLRVPVIARQLASRSSSVRQKAAECKISMFIYGILQYFSFKTLQNILNFD